MKTRVEKLCQAFENGKELVELSQCSPHDISNVLKLYLRQVRMFKSCILCLFWCCMFRFFFLLNLLIIEIIKLNQKHGGEIRVKLTVIITTTIK